ncbi:protein N-terminal asparagine amidohydrolase [Impatiens glandulifera]|uniref:protein N-terminal asparagine amidohydrolase n=1 Tax=Impatiens glandulifera TaxID=253017 RepID=UPI001FB0AF6F|nr:protein N-terminal asparagine amidohydrolase [Impatiens glandulifera]
MIYVDGVPFSSKSASSSQGGDTVLALLENPILASASASFNGISVHNYSVSQETESRTPSQQKCVYVFQREYATVDPALVDFVGTDEATTCVALVIRNRRSGMTSVAHMDSPKVVDIGLKQMLTLLVDKDSHDELDVHLVGGFDDASNQKNISGKKRGTIAKPDGYSFPLCAKIILSLQQNRRSFNILTFHVLGNNTRCNADGHPVPIFHGLLVDTSSGSVMAATFDRSTRCPDELIRRIRVSASFEDPRWKGKLLDTYHTQTDRFNIAPCSWSNHLLHIASSVMNLSDSEILLSCSTSPFAESPDFVDNERRLFNYLLHSPDWKDTFPMNQSRVYKRNSDGGWIRC